MEALIHTRSCSKSQRQELGLSNTMRCRSLNFKVPASERDMMRFSGLTFHREPQGTAKISAGIWSRPDNKQPPSSLPSVINYLYDSSTQEHTYGSPPLLMDFTPNSPVIFPPNGSSGNRTPITLGNQTQSLKGLKRTVSRKRKGAENREMSRSKCPRYL